MASADTSSNSRSPSGDLVGQVLEGRYRIVRRIGAGGMGAVYEAEHVALRTRVAIKVLKEEMAAEDTHRLRFLREARAATAISSVHVVQLTDFGGTDGGIAFFVMEYLEGKDLEHIARTEGRVPWPRARHLLLQIAAALRAAHSEGIVHRDVKPANVLVFDDPKRNLYDFVKVLDFGIAKVSFVDDELNGLTATGEAFGTPAYMAPELADGQPATPATDIYALGILAYRILTGELPFTGTNPYQIFARHLRDEPKAPRLLEPSIPPAAEEVILRCLAKRPAERFADMAEVDAALQSIPVDETVHTFSLTLPLRRTLEPASTAATGPTEPMGVGSTGTSMTVAAGASETAPSVWTRKNIAVLAAFVLIGVTTAAMTALLVRDDPEPSLAAVTNTKAPDPAPAKAVVEQAPPPELGPDEQAANSQDSTSGEPDDTTTTASPDPQAPAPPPSPAPQPTKGRKKPASPDDAAISAAKKSLRSACSTGSTHYKVSFFVTPTGKVLDVQVSNGDPTKYDCLKTVMKAQSFPKGDGRKKSFTL